MGVRDKVLGLDFQFSFSLHFEYDSSDNLLIVPDV